MSNDPLLFVVVKIGQIVLGWKDREEFCLEPNFDNIELQVLSLPEFCEECFSYPQLVHKTFQIIYMPIEILEQLLTINEIWLDVIDPDLYNRQNGTIKFKKKRFKRRFDEYKNLFNTNNVSSR
jgi:hypothetical protein